MSICKCGHMKTSHWLDNNGFSCGECGCRGFEARTD